MLLDISRAFLYGEMWRNVYLEFPPQGPRYGYGSVMGKCRKAACGARDALQIWGETVKKRTLEVGNGKEVKCLNRVLRRGKW